MSPGAQGHAVRCEFTKLENALGALPSSRPTNPSHALLTDFPTNAGPDRKPPAQLSSPPSHAGSSRPLRSKKVSLLAPPLCCGPCGFSPVLWRPPRDVIARGTGPRRRSGEPTMATIGIVTKTATGFRGTLQTLMMKAQISIVPNEKDRDGQPDYRVIAKGGFELGAGWVRRNREDEEYISLSLAAPEFGGRLYANLGRAPGSKDEEERYAVVWNPPAQRQ